MVAEREQAIEAELAAGRPEDSPHVQGVFFGHHEAGWEWYLAKSILLLYNVQWYSGCNGPQPGMRVGSSQRPSPRARWFKAVPSRKLGFHSAPLCKEWLRPWNNMSLTGQGSNSATCRTRRVSLRRSGHAVRRAADRASRKPFAIPHSLFETKYSSPHYKQAMIQCIGSKLCTYSKK